MKNYLYDILKHTATTSYSLKDYIDRRYSNIEFPKDLSLEEFEKQVMVDCFDLHTGKISTIDFKTFRTIDSLDHHCIYGRHILDPTDSPFADILIRIPHKKDKMKRVILTHNELFLLISNLQKYNMSIYEYLQAISI